MLVQTPYPKSKLEISNYYFQKTFKLRVFQEDFFMKSVLPLPACAYWKKKKNKEVYLSFTSSVQTGDIK